MKINCIYKSYAWHLADNQMFYDCTIKHQVIPEDEPLEFIGTHDYGKTNKDVTVVEILFSQVTRFPQGLTKIFPNLRCINLNSSKLKKITKADLAEYRQLQYLWIDGNEIEFLPGDLLEGFENLEIFSFELNKGKVVEPNILNGQKKLKFANFCRRPYNGDKFYSIIPAWRGNASLDEVKHNLYERYYEYQRSLQESSLKPEFQATSKHPEFSETSENHEVDMENLSELEKLSLKANQSDTNAFINNELLKTLGFLVPVKCNNSDVAPDSSRCSSASGIRKESKNSKLNKIKKLRKSKEILEEKINILEQEKKDLQLKLSELQPKNQDAESKNFNSDLQNFLQDENFKDFKIIIQDTEFSVHKFIFAARSPTIAEMIRENPEAENLKLVDISVDIFEILLNFVYKDELPDENFNNFLHLFAAAGRLSIENLKNFAAQKVLDQIFPENILEIYNFGCKYQHNEMKQKSYSEIKKMYDKIDFKDDWIEQPEKVIKIIEAFKKKEQAMKEFEKILKEN